MVEKNQQKNLLADQAEIMAPRIPSDEENGALLNVILYDLAFGDAAAKKARSEHRKNSLNDGFTMRFLIQSCIEGTGAGTTQHIYADIQEDGSIMWSEAVNDGLYIKGWDTNNSYALKNAQIKPPATERQECVAYATLWEQRYGVPFDIAIAILNSFQKKYGVGEFDATKLKVGEDPVQNFEFGTGLKLTLFRRSYKDKNGNFQTNWGVWDKKAKTPIQTEVTVVPKVVADKIFSEMVKWDEARKANKDTTFAYGANVKSAADTDASLEKEVGF